VRAVDNLGNAGPTAHFTVRVDTTPPQTSDDAPSGTQTSTVTVRFDATDAHSGVAQTYYTVNGGLAQEGTSVEIADLGTTQLTYWSVDAVGNTESAHSVSVTIGLEGTLRINNGASSTDVARVLLHSSVARAAQMRFSNDGSTWSEWEAYAPVKVWTLTSGAGAKTVQAQYRNAATSLELNDTVQLDATRPGGMMQINNGASSTADLAVTLTNEVSGAVEMRFRDAGGAWSDWEPFAASKSWTLPAGGEATKTGEAEFRDAEADVLSTSDSIVVDAAAPTGTMTIASGGPYAKQAAVTLNMNVAGAAEMRFRDAGGAWSDWEPYASTKSWTIAGGDGLKLVEGQFRNAAQELLDCPDAVTLDTHGPDAPRDVTASWVRLSGNNGRVSVRYRGTEADALSPLVVTAVIKTYAGVTRKTATYSGDSLDTVISRAVSSTLTKGSYRVVIGMADEAGNAAPESATVTFSVR